MFYEPRKKNHGLPHAPLKAIIAPRPIGWISTLSPEGVANLAPYSFFNQIADTPPLVMFSSVGRKDSLTNVEATGEFVCNLATLPLIDAVNASSAPFAPEVDEFEKAGLEKADCVLVKAPRVAASPCALECRYIETVALKGIDGAPADATMVIGEVVGVHVDERVIVDGRVDTALMQALARCGYMDYAPVDRLVARNRPKGG